MYWFYLLRFGIMYRRPANCGQSSFLPDVLLNHENAPMGPLFCTNSENNYSEIYVLTLNVVPAARQRECNLTRFRNFRSISRENCIARYHFHVGSAVMRCNFSKTGHSRFFTSCVPLNKFPRQIGLVLILVTCFILPYKLKIIIAITHESTILQKKQCHLLSFAITQHNCRLCIEWTFYE